MTAGAYIAIPIPGSPVPIVLQNMFVVFTGLVLPPLWASLAVGVYLLLGAAGLPVLAGAAGGLAHFAGPTGGFLVGYPVAAWVTAVLLRVGRSMPAAMYTAHPLRQVTAIFAGFIAVYFFGIPRLTAITGLSLYQTLWIGLIPFVPGDIIKAAALFLLVRTVPASVWRSWT